MNSALGCWPLAIGSSMIEVSSQAFRYAARSHKLEAKSCFSHESLCYGIAYLFKV